jgi:protein-tyrosine-phosphatase
MKIATVARAALLVISAAALSACGKTMGPYPVEVMPSQKFELHAVSGKTLSFEADRSFDAVATFFGRKKLVQMNIGTEVVKFTGAQFDKTSGQVIAPAEKTGQDVGVTVATSQVCDPDCEVLHTRRDYYSCTYYIDERYTVCRPAGNGAVICSTHWRQVPRAGHQWVEVTEITRKFGVKANLLDRSNVELAKASGTYLDKTEEVRALSACF